jgi:uncharacterized membrane protein YjgN (DUF898 family)
VIIPTYRRALEKMRQRPTPPPAAPSMPVIDREAADAREPATDGAPATNEPVAIHRFQFHAVGGSLFGIHIVNVLLTLVTLGLYYFWGKVRVRRYLMSQTEFEGDRFAYHGTGGELLLGFLKAMIFFFLPLVALGAVPLVPGGKPLEPLARVLTYIIVAVFVPVAMIGARRYRLSRTSWRGIRFSLRARTRTFVRLFLEGSFLTSITLSIYYPIFETRRFGFLTAHSYFGQRPFGFDGHGRELLRPYLLTLLLTLPTVGICWFWFQARKLRYFWSHTTFEGARFRCFVTGGGLLKLAIVNALLLIVTLGLGWPWVVARNGRFVCSMIELAGVLNLEAIVQEPQTAPATGDALSSLIGADVDFG